MASTAIRPDPGLVTIAGMAEGNAARLDLDVQDLTAAIHAVLRVDPMRAEGAAISRILGELGRFESVGGAAVSAATFGLLAFRIGHGRRMGVRADLETARGFC